jgi:hypothetical protein
MARRARRHDGHQNADGKRTEQNPDWGSQLEQSWPCTPSTCRRSDASADHERPRSDPRRDCRVPWSTIAAHAGGELLVMSLWLALALATFGVFMRAGQRDGSLEYAA